MMHIFQQLGSMDRLTEKQKVVVLALATGLPKLAAATHIAASGCVTAKQAFAMAQELFDITIKTQSPFVKKMLQLKRKEEAFQKKLLKEWKRRNYCGKPPKGLKPEHFPLGKGIRWGDDYLSAPLGAQTLMGGVAEMVPHPSSPQPKKRGKK